MMKGKTSSRIDDLLASVTSELVGGDVLQQIEQQGLRVERILLELVRPDPVQPRRVLPDRIHTAFHNNRITPTQALRELVQTAQIAARQHGRPFDGLVDLLPKPDDDGDDEMKAPFSPEERLVRDLVNLAITIRDDGQVNPLTVVDVSQGVTRLYRIETGERRYWASWLLRDFIPHYQGDGMIPCIVIPQQQASPFRQAKENTARSGLSAVALARQAALLLLTVHGYEIPYYAVDNDFYRQALSLNLRSKQEYSGEILSAMGGIGRMHFSRYKALLRLSDEALELADRHNIEEGKLRYILDLEPQYQAELLQQVIDLNLTVRQIKEICESGVETKDVTEDSVTIPKQALQIAKLTRSSVNANGADIARALLQFENDPDLARARIRALLRLLNEAELHLPSQ